MSLEGDLGSVPPSGEEDSSTTLPTTSEATVTPQQQSSDASLLSASELPGSISTLTQPEGQASDEPTPTVDESPHEKNWVDVLGSKQLMKRVC